MNHNYNEIWENYTASWKVESIEEKRALFENCLDSECKYNDPLIKTTGWDELLQYMLDFHQQIPGGHFITTYFLSHSDKSITKWEMRDADETLLGDGISYAEYNKAGKLISMTGFFEMPQ